MTAKVTTIKNVVPTKAMKKFPGSLADVSRKAAWSVFPNAPREVMVSVKSQRHRRRM
jgi:hypothetical protein